MIRNPEMDGHTSLDRFWAHGESEKSDHRSPRAAAPYYPWSPLVSSPPTRLRMGAITAVPFFTSLTGIVLQFRVDFEPSGSSLWLRPGRPTQ
jgi:hypothetical protein